MNIESASENYLKILKFGQEDVLSSAKSGNSKDFYAALERHKVLTESVYTGVKALTEIVLYRSEEYDMQSRLDSISSQ